MALSQTAISLYRNEENKQNILISTHITLFSNGNIILSYGRTKKKHYYAIKNYKLVISQFVTQSSIRDITITIKQRV